MKFYGEMGWRMSFKVHMLDAYLDELKENMAAYSEEHGEPLDFKRRYHGQHNERMKGDYIYIYMGADR